MSQTEWKKFHATLPKSGGCADDAITVFNSVKKIDIIQNLPYYNSFVWKKPTSETKKVI